MNQPAFKDGDDDGSDELDVDFIPDDPPRFFWAADKDEVRRSFIFDKLADSQVDGKILVENMEAVFRWITKGELPKSPKKSHLKVAES